MTLKGAALLLLAIVVLVGATGGDSSAAAIGNALGEAFRWVQIALDAAFGGDAA